ncbi:MAG: FAD-dependent oxidoreductase [Polaromonas sp.]|uniref:hydroxysqualene dehydroxylase HpnE n=1 Tax=Polaromonas sp. TaxID=1869339 RepID=UPI0025E052E4|nr:hydroxysqualene dehydroxylase HpnE [Polaromonas sp.]MBI2728913.1 FAD-dependent oxidoreductase [Polaromonas sp.]
MKVAVIGAGWAGCAAAVEATWLGHQVTLFEAARTVGGRARKVELEYQGQALALDNGQHILIGAYTDTLQLMKDVGVDSGAGLLRMPLTLQFPDGDGLKLPNRPAPLDAVWGILTARGWSWGEKFALIRVATGWRLKNFECAPALSVADICKGLPPRIMATFIEPLCVSALNTPPERSSGQVFLRVLHDSLFSVSGGSNLLLPRLDLGALLPDAACHCLKANGGLVNIGARVQALKRTNAGWQLQLDAADADTAQVFDKVVLACQPQEAARLVETTALPCDGWIASARALEHEAIATVYAMAPGARLALPMLALRSGEEFPAQFVFDRGQLGGPAGLLAFVISASHGSAATLGEQVQKQAAAQLGIAGLLVLQTIVEKRATFACTPGLHRPAMHVAQHLLACGDYVDGPYPATLEGAVRSGLVAARGL